MTPAEHYAEAERLLADAAKLAGRGRDVMGPFRDVSDALAAAHVHATLAAIPPDVAASAPRLSALQLAILGVLGRSEEDLPVDLVAVQSGGNNSNVAACLHDLQEQGLVHESDGSWEVTPAGRTALAAPGGG